MSVVFHQKGKIEKIDNGKKFRVDAILHRQSGGWSFAMELRIGRISEDGQFWIMPFYAWKKSCRKFDFIDQRSNTTVEGLTSRQARSMLLEEATRA